MRATVRRPLIGGVMALGGVLAVVAGVATMDVRVRQRIADLVDRQAVSGEVSSSLGYLSDVAMAVFQALQERSVDHAPLTLFSVAAVALVFFLVRTKI